MNTAGAMNDGETTMMTPTLTMKEKAWVRHVRTWSVREVSMMPKSIEYRLRIRPEDRSRQFDSRRRRGRD
jgi:hypothetical protein